MSEEELEEAQLEAIRRRRLAELQRATVEEQHRAQIQEQAENQKQAILRQILTQEARQRLANIRIVKPEFAQQLEMQLIQLAQTGRVKLPITDDQLREALSKLLNQRKEIRIRRA